MATLSKHLVDLIAASVIDGDLALFDGGAINIYSGSPPAAARTAPSGTLLASIPLDTPAFEAGSGDGQFQIPDTVQDPSGNASGTAGYARIVSATDAGTTNDADPRIQISVGTSGTELVLGTTSIVSGQPVQVTSCVITVPKS